MRVCETTSTVATAGLGPCGKRLWDQYGLCFAHETLQSPCLATLDVAGHARERDQRTELPAATKELEAVM
jgi:hypothetical protein